MTASAKAFLERLIDYAGLFPPASLELEESARNYLAYTRHDTAWMLGRMICPAGRIAELASLGARWGAPPIPVSLLARPHREPEGFLVQLDQDLAAIREDPACGEQVSVEVVEARFPDTLIEAWEQPEVTRCLKRSREILNRSELAAADLFFEAAALCDRGQAWGRLAAALADFRRKHGQSPSIGLKLRCGGVEAQAFPSAEELAEILERVARDPVKVKATAGLHHPLRRQVPELGVAMHGFFNLFGAGMLAWEGVLKGRRLLEMMQDEDARHFKFTDDGFQWRSMACPTPRIREIRSDFLLSFGSCSFDEPREDLAALGLLPRFSLTQPG